MTKTFTKVTRRPEFEKGLKNLLKRYKSLEEDLLVFEKAQLNLYHKQNVDNRGIVSIENLGRDSPKIFKAVKFACKSLPTYGAASGIRLIYAYFEESDHIEFIKIYFKTEEESENLARIKSLYPKSISS